MNVDPRSLQNATALQCDVCIVGSGAAGITLACELDQPGINIILLEAGGTKYDVRMQKALHGEVAEGSLHCPPDMYRRRMLGGATTIWGGRCVPLSSTDLEFRDYVPNSGWPIRWEELERYYPAAQTYCEAGKYTYSVIEALGAGAPQTIEGFSNSDVESDRIERFSPPTDFGKTYRERLTKSLNVRVILRTRATRLMEAGGAIDGLEAQTETLRRFVIRSRHYVLAMGGLETPRLLMTSDDTRRGGIGNEGDSLGRFYMCHLENTLGVLRLRPKSRRVILDFERTPQDGIYVRRKFTISSAAQQREALLNTTARLHYPLIADPRHRNGVLSTMYVVKDAIIPEYRRKLATIEIANRDALVRDVHFWAAHLANIGSDAYNVGRFAIGWLRHRTLARRKLPFVVQHSCDGSYPLDVNAEQIPDSDNRVTLSGQIDSDGLRRIRINWRLTEQDTDSLARTMRLLRDAFAQSGCGVLELDEEHLLTRVKASTPVGGHHIGTTRMADNPKRGVVDRHCTVHGLHNLHVTGAAVFPTCGHANPTLTVVALAVRLADRLRNLLQKGPTAVRPARVCDI
jgi:choline dehydrogenase-like flavoprotein